MRDASAAVSWHASCYVSGWCGNVHLQDGRVRVRSDVQVFVYVVRTQLFVDANSLLHDLGRGTVRERNRQGAG